MKSLATHVFSALFCLSSICLFAEGNIADSSTGTTFPSEITIQSNGKDYKLQATGVSTRRKFFVKVYSVASYLQDANQLSGGGDKFQQILQSDKAKQLTLKWVHEGPVSKIQDGYRESFHSVLPEAQYNQMKNDIEKYISFFNTDTKPGDEQVIRWLPGGTIEVLFNGKSAGTITNKEFATALWTIWFGPNSVVKRDDLVSLLK